MFTYFFFIENFVQYKALKTRIRDILSIAIFFILIIVAILAVRPAYTGLLDHMTDSAREFKAGIEEKLSLKISYKKLSPSILSSVNIREVTLFTTEGKKIASINKIRLDYRLLKLLKGDFANGFKNLVVDGADVSGSELVSLFTGREKKPEEPEKKAKESGRSLNLNFLNADIPLSILFKNISVTYRVKEVSSNLSIRKMDVDYDNQMRQLTLGAESSASLVYNNKKLSGNLSFDGKIFEGFENSTLNLCLSGLTDGNIKLSKINLLASYNNDEISCSTIKNTFPLGISFSYNLSEGKAKGSVKATEMTAASVMQMNRKSSIFKKIDDLKLTTNTNVLFDVNDKKLDYSTETQVFVPESILPGSGSVKIAFSGNDREINITELSLSGEDYDIDGNLNLIFKTLNVSGLLEIEKIQLSNGAFISTEVYFDPLKKGFMAFIPQLFIDENVLTALQFTLTPGEDSMDFSFEGYDYSHFEAHAPGRINIDGSYLLSDNYLQTSLSANSFFLDSVLKTAGSFLQKSAKDALVSGAESVKDFVFSSDAYFSTDLSSISFNVPYILIANTQKDNQALMFSLDGNEQSISISQADLIFGKEAFHASGSLDILEETHDMFLLLDLTAGNIPYHFAGTIANSMVDLTGDYETSVRVDYSKPNLLSASASFLNLPVSIMGTSVIASLDTDFSYSTQDGFNVNLNRFELEEAGNTIRFKPHLALGGKINGYGAHFDSIVYSDLFSELDGTADIFFALEDSVLESAGIKIQMKNPLSEESVLINLDASNPDRLPLGLDAIMNSFYLDASVVANNLDMNRFSTVNSSNNVLTGSVYLTGTLEQPYVSAGLDNFSLLVSGDVMRMSGSAIMENREVTLNDFIFDLGSTKIDQVSGNFDLSSFTGVLLANINADFIEESIHMPVKLELKDPVKKEGGFMPSAFTLNLITDQIYGSFFKENKQFSLTANVSENGINIISSENLGLVASYLTSGKMSASLNCEGLGTASYEGTYDSKTGEINGKLSKVNLDVGKFFSVANFDEYVCLLKGHLVGSITVSGTLDNPLFTGAMSLVGPEFTVPYVGKDLMATDKFLITFMNGEIVIPERKVMVKKNGEMYASCRIVFDKWSFERLESVVRTDKGKYVPVEIEVGLGMSVVGDANFNLSMVLGGGTFSLTGNVLAEKAEYYISLSKMVSSLTSEEETDDDSMKYHIDLGINVGTHVRLSFDPLLRAVFVPGGKLDLLYDTRSSVFSMNGLLVLKSGDVSWLNRNFYVREGSMKFAPSDGGFDPIMNVRAETRERDAEGNNVTISLNAFNQHVRDFNPRFSSVPAKSEAEIQALLGQIVVADSENVGNFLFAAGDYAIQTLFGRKLENKLRDSLNFDIFSLRTNFIQNTLNLSLSRDNQNSMSFGNFFDNSTVYIGKYLGSALYVDAMLNLQYDEKRKSEDTLGILFRPEFGVEMESPFVNIRWNVAPDIEAMMQKQYVPSSSVSLSWKFSL